MRLTLLLASSLAVGSHAAQRNWDHKEALRGHTRRVRLQDGLGGSRPLLNRGGRKNQITCPFPSSSPKASTSTTSTAASPLPNKWEVVQTDAVFNGTAHTAPTRDRRAEDACGSFDSIGEHLVDMMESDDGSSRHYFEDADGSLTIQWAGQPEPNMLVNAEIKSLNIFEDNSELRTLYNSQDHGTTFTPAGGIDEPILDAVYAAVPMKTGPHKGKYPAFATPEDGGNKYLYMSMDGGAHFKKFAVDEHFDYIVPHPAVPDRFLGFDVEANAQSMTVFVCDNVMEAFTVEAKTGTIKDKCVKAHDQVIDADWIMHDSSRWMSKNFGIYFTQFKGKIEDDQLTLYKWIATIDGEPKKPVKINPSGLDNVDHFVQTNDYLFVTDVPSKGKDADLSEQNLYVSTDEGATWTTSKFPKSADSKSNFFSIVDASENEVFVAVSHTFTEVRGDAKVKIADLDGKEVPGLSGSILATRAIFSEIITAVAPNPNWGVAGMVAIKDTGEGKGCPEDGPLKPVPQDGKNYVYVLDRGICTFVAKLQNAYEAGAAAVIIVNADDTHNVYMSSPEGNLAANIPEVIVNNTIGQLIYKMLGDGDKNGLQIQFYEENQETSALYTHSNLYMSEGGEQYTIAVKDVVYTDSEDWRRPAYVDVVKCNSVNGTYMANFFDEGKETTIITYDKGAFWWSLTLMDNKQAKQLHISMEKYNTLYRMPQPVSTDSATGVILANGWVTAKGDGIPERSKLISTAQAVLSEDGGRTWKVVDSEPHDFRILDHGGVLVFVPWNKKVDTMKFSLDEGKTVQSFKFLNDGVAGDLVGAFADSSKGWGNFGDVAIDCQKTTHMVVGNKFEDRFTCTKGNSLGAVWSPGIVTLNVAGTTVTMHGNDGNVYTGSYAAGKITWDQKDAAGKAWSWTGAVGAGTGGDQPLVQIQGVATEPGGKSLIMMAYYYNFAAKSWVGVKMDFDVLFFTECDAERDFEEWTVTSHKGTECVLGKKQTVQRRKQCSFCKNSLDFERKVATDTDRCACSREDYQCNYGYTFTKKGSCEHAYDCQGGECQPDIDFYRDLCTGTARPMIPHIVKVPNDECVEGAVNDWNAWAQPQPLQCDGQAPKGGTTPAPKTGITPAPKTNAPPGGSPGASTGGNGDGKKSNKATIIGIVVALVLVIGVVGAIMTRRQSVSLSISADRYTAVHNEDMPGDDDDLGGL